MSIDSTAIFHLNTHPFIESIKRTSKAHLKSILSGINSLYECELYLLKDPINFLQEEQTGAVNMPV